jgi:hypothetical protein
MKPMVSSSRGAAKLYCHVDESGQDTAGALFVVSVVVMAGEEQEQAMALCEAFEAESGKGRVKWNRARQASCLHFIQLLLAEPFFQGKLYFSAHQNSTDYLALTIQTTARAIERHAQHPYKVTVLIDGLPRSQQRTVGKLLRNLGIQTRKVRGVRKEENDALSRLADALCGWVRAAVDGQQTPMELFEQGKKQGYLREVE